MTCVDVLRNIITLLSLQSAKFCIFEHFVDVNWRQRFQSTEQKIQHIRDGLIQHIPNTIWKLQGEDILRNEFNPNDFVSHKIYVISVSSKIELCGRVLHLPIMNLHPETDLTYDDMKLALEATVNGMSGYLLHSGRYFHFYGVDLLNQDEWLRFMAQFLMPTILVSPRFIGHCLYRGYAALRLTTENNHKPKIPTVCDFIGTLQTWESKNWS